MSLVRWAVLGSARALSIALFSAAAFGAMPASAELEALARAAAVPLPSADDTSIDGKEEGIESSRRHVITSVRQVCYALMDVIERALLDLQEEKIASQPSHRLIRLWKDLRVILEFSKSEVMAIFGKKLVSAMAACFQPGTKRSTISLLREHAQTKFVSLRI